MRLSILYKLKEKAKIVKWKNDSHKEYYILFSKSGFSDELIEVSQKDSTIILSNF